MFSSNENNFDEPAAAPNADPTADTPHPSDDSNPEHKKRNSGRTGPTSAQGRATSSQNAIKHGACAKTLILPHESIADWELLFSRWLDAYQPDEDSLEYDFVLKTAQAEWFRLRAQRNYDDYLATLETRAPFAWSQGEIKMHDLMLRYKTAAERSFQREYRLLEQYYKAHKPASQPAESQSTPKSKAKPESQPRYVPGLRFVRKETGEVVSSTPGGWYSPETGFIPETDETPPPT